MPNLTHHQRNADENLSDTSFTPVRTAIISGSPEIANAGEDQEE